MDSAGSADESGTFDQSMCSEFEDSDGPSDELIAALPGRFGGALTAIKDFGEALDSMGDNEDDGSIDALVDVLSTEGLGTDLSDLAAYAEEQCGVSEGSKSIAAVASAATIATADEDEEYCAALKEMFASTDEDGSTANDLEALREVAPDAHLPALDALAAVDADPSDEDAQMGAFGALLGLGIYSESTCGIDGALPQMLLGAMFMGLDSGTDSGTDDDAPPPDVDPTVVPDADPAAATSALPAGSAITFGVRSADLDADGEYLASIVVPDGWEEESSFDVTYSPPADSGVSIFTSIEVGAGCDGVCEPNDWDARLRGADGYLTSYLSSHPSASESPIPGSEGVVLTSTIDEVTALVLRWDDGADKYFSCEVDLEDEQADLLPAFVEACVSARPAWFAVG
jgi:hypothetical protein